MPAAGMKATADRLFMKIPLTKEGKRMKLLQRKRLLRLLLIACCIALSIPCAFAGEFTYFDKNDQIDYAKSCLTEVFGYTYEDAQAFCFEQTEQDGIATVRYWHPDFPDWVYTSQFSLTDGQKLGSNTPFASSYQGYPGENSVRFILTQVHKENLLRNWNKAARQRFSEIMEQDGFQPNADLEKGLLNATYTPQEALEDFFLTCYGSKEKWPQAVSEWQQWFLDTYHLESVQPSETAEGVTRYRIEDDHPRVMTEFYHAVPPELAEVFLNHPMLEGWTVISGVMMTFDRQEDTDSAVAGEGLVTFGQEEKRLLCAIDQQKERWYITPISFTALPDGCDPLITRKDSMSILHLNRFLIEWENDSYQDVTMGVAIVERDNGTTGYLSQCSFTDAITKHHYRIDEVAGFLSLIVTDPESAQENMMVLSNSAIPVLLPYLDITTLLEAAKQPDAVHGQLFPENIIACNGVHLRKEATTHSKDQGTLLAGTLATKLGSEKGKDAPWYHVQIGLLEGYVSGTYVDEIPLYTSTSTLPVAIASEDAALVENTGLFAPKVADISKGTSMHVIMEAGNWYYVCIPQTQPADMWMDPDGTYGYIKADQVLVGNNLLQLEWALAEEK